MLEMSSKKLAKNAKLISSSILFSVLLASCQSGKVKETVKKSEKEILVRVTSYDKMEGNWTRKGKTASGMPLIDRKTAAVDPKVFPYGSIIKLPEIGVTVVANDTGSAVKSRKAAIKNKIDCPVIDLYFESKWDANKFAKEGPMFTTAIIESIPTPL